MFLHTEIIDATPSHEDEATLYFNDEESIEITVAIGCASPGVNFTWSRPENTENSSQPCPGNTHFSTSTSIFRKDNPTKDDAGEITLSITHPKLKSRKFTWNLICE